MIEAKDAVVWINKDDKSVKVARARADFPLGWGDPIRRALFAMARYDR